MADQTFDLITIGDSTVDTFIRIHDATVECDINREACKICVPYGSKVSVDSIATGIAGNAANVAVGASRLGLKVAIYTNLGGDEHGRNIKSQFIEEGVSLDYVIVDETKESNLSVVLTFQGERTIFAYHQDWFYHLPVLARSNWVYLTSMSESFVNSKIMDEVCHYVNKASAKLIFAPGTSQLKADVKRFPRVLELTKILIVNMDEAKQILNLNPTLKVDPKDAMSKLMLLGPKIIVITDGEEGSYATEGKNDYKIGVFPVQVKERTGAGDSYSSGFLSALFWGLPLPEAMVWGTINAAHVISGIGAEKNLMTKDEIERYRKTVNEMKAVEF